MTPNIPTKHHWNIQPCNRNPTDNPGNKGLRCDYGNRAGSASFSIQKACKDPADPNEIQLRKQNYFAGGCGEDALVGKDSQLCRALNKRILSFVKSQLYAASSFGLKISLIQL